jgi:hypothetical protein
MKGTRFNTFGFTLAAMLVIASTLPGRAYAESAEGKNLAGSLIQVVRDTTEKYKDVLVAQNEGFTLQFGCVSGPDSGAMGMHFVNFPRVIDGKIEVTEPEIVIYEPQPNGSLKLIGADYLVLADAWDSKHPEGPPQMMGQLFHYFEAPNRFGLPAFYTLHVWAWKENPAGAFVNWHSNVSCTSFNGQGQ